MTYLYIETDGEVFLVEKDGKLTLPEEGFPLPFETRELFTNKFPEGDVKFCKPIVEEHPTSWIYKDDIPAMDNVEKIVLRAVNYSLVRHISSAIIIKDKKVLILKGNRGFAKGKWHVPGGFISYPESPEKSVVRECKEELGIDIKVKELITTFSEVRKYPGHYYLALSYLCEILPGQKIKLDISENSELKWLPLKEAIDKVDVPHAKKTFEKLLCRGGSEHLFMGSKTKKLHQKMQQ